MAKERGLGRGINGLIQNKVIKPETAAAADANGGSIMIPISKVERDKSQPRSDFNEEKLEELAESIRQYGIVEPLVVQNRGTYYEIVAGERRWRAAQKAGLTEVPVVVRSFTEEEKAEIQLIENLQREDLNPIEEALAFKSLKERFSMTDDQVAERVSKSRAYVTNSMRLLKLDSRVQQMVVDEQLSSGHVRALIPVEDPDTQYQMAQDAFDQKLSVREVERQVRKLSKDAKKTKIKEEDKLEQVRLQYEKYAEELSSVLGVRVQVDLNDINKGKLTIDFYDSADFENLCRKLKGTEE